MTFLFQKRTYSVGRFFTFFLTAYTIALGWISEEAVGFQKANPHIPFDGQAGSGGEVLAHCPPFPSHPGYLPK